MPNKRGFSFGFAWIFAIIVGAIIIFLAIFATTRLVETQRSQSDTVRAKEIGILLTPVELGIEQSKTATIIVPDETRLVNDCTTDGTFGRQQLSSYVRSGVGGAWQPVPGVTSSFRNKYLFSDSESHAKKNFYLFSKPFKFPFKVADITMLWPDTEVYCFVFTSQSGTQRSLKQELEDLSPTNVKVETELAACEPESKTVCFDTPACDINIRPGQKTVTKNSEIVSYVESLDIDDRYALLYAAIFSDPEIYNCQIARMGERASAVADLLIQKSNYLTPRGCNSAPMLPIALNSYKNALSTVTSSADLSNAETEANFLKQKNDDLWPCKIF